MPIGTETNFMNYKDNILAELRDKYPDKSELQIRAIADCIIQKDAANGLFDSKLSDIPTKEENNGEDTSRTD